MRRLAIVLALVALLVVPSAAQAGKPEKYTDFGTFIDCVVTADGASGFVFAQSSDVFDDYAEIVLWTDDAGDDDPPTWSGSASTVDDSGSNLAATIEIADASGPVGDAIFDADYAPDGDTETFEDDFRNGNSTFRSTFSQTPLAVIASLALPASFGTVTVSDCSGQRYVSSVFVTNPSARVVSGALNGLDCEIAGETGSAYLYIIPFIPDFPLEVTWMPDGGEMVTGQAGFEIDDTLSIEIELFTADGTLATTAQLEADVAFGQTYEYVQQFSNGDRRATGVEWDLSGTITIDGEALPLAGCNGFTDSFKDIITAQQGPKPSTRLLPNDVPDAARPIAVGGSVVQGTRRTAYDAEADVSCLDFVDPDSGDVFDIPALHTLWYEVVGTGGPITIDTKGSLFDTVVAVYDAGLEPVDGACNDDVFLGVRSPDARVTTAKVTFMSEAGATYLVQAGSFPTDVLPYGQLKLSVR